MLKHSLSLYLLFFSFFLLGQEGDKTIEHSFNQGVTVDLREPLFEDGVLTTDKGGVIQGPNGLRVQALKIRYTRKLIDGKPVFRLEAEDQLIVEFENVLFIGKKLFYDFQTETGFIEEGRTTKEPWFFGGEKIELWPDHSYIIYNGFVTTSENLNPEWELFMDKVHITDKMDMAAQKVQFRLWHYPLLWIPSLNINLNSIFESPIRYRFRWGGKLGPRFGLTYEIFSWEHWKTFLRFDYRLTRGPGGGLETYYNSEDGKTQFQSINYLAKDASLLNPHEKARFRFEGAFSTLLDADKVSVLMTYDKVSDIEMPGNYYDKDFDFETSERTQLWVRRQEENWISHFYTRVRINGFQTVKQELPSFGLNYRPFVLNSTGIIFQNRAKASYLDFKYAKNVACVKDFDSTRFEYHPRLYRPFSLGPLTLTPEAGGVFLFYGNSPQKEARALGVGILGGDLITHLHRFYGPFKHVIKPYISYRFFSAPTVAPRKHFIFDIEDGWVRLNKLTFGLENSLYLKKTDHCVSRLLFADIFAHAFFASGHIKPIIPLVYGRLIYFFLPTMKQTLETAWDFWHSQLDHFNIQLDWTLSNDTALSMQYRHRSAFSWRKADIDSFFLEAFHSDKRLRHSQLSDRRDTFLMHAFYRFHPNWAVELSTRYGWNRSKEPRYSEYEVNFFTTIQSAWHLKFSFMHTEDDNRVAMYVNVGSNRPDLEKIGPCACTFE